MEAKRTDIVLSLSGRDKGRRFFVVDADEKFLFLADGKLRKAEKPKRKKRKHTQYVCPGPRYAAEKLARDGKITNSDIRRALAHSNDCQTTSEGGKE